jgi:hypothetical protein
VHAPQATVGASEAALAVVLTTKDDTSTTAVAAATTARFIKSPHFRVRHGDDDHGQA